MYQINATQVVGLLSFGITAVICFAVWRSIPHVKITWGWLTIVYVTLTVDILVDGRHFISNTLRTIFKSIDLYQNRGIWQILLVILLLTLAGTIARKILQVSRQQDGTIPKAAYATALTLTFFVIETISSHKIDAMLYHKAGPVLLIGWIWAALAALTITLSISALRGSSRPDVSSSSQG